MDIEQLKLILQTIEGTAESAKLIALTWLIFQLIKVLLFWAFWAAATTLGYKLIKNMCAASKEETDGVRIIRECRDLILPENAGTFVTDGEISIIKTKIREAFKDAE